MGNLSNDLISQFVKITKDNVKSKKETFSYGTIVADGESIYVQLDGSEILTPVNTTTKVAHGERVIVMIKNHSATVIGNTTDPSIKGEDIKDVLNQLAAYDKKIASMVTVQSQATVGQVVVVTKVDKNGYPIEFSVENKVDESQMIGIDTTLTIEGKAADSKIVGDEIRAIKIDIGNVEILLSNI